MTGLPSKEAIVPPVTPKKSAEVKVTGPGAAEKQIIERIDSILVRSASSLEAGVVDQAIQDIAQGVAQKKEGEQDKEANFTPLNPNVGEEQTVVPVNPETQKALANLDLENLTDSRVVAELLIRSELQAIPELKIKLAEMQRRRLKDSYSTRSYDPSTVVLDEAVVLLIQDNHPELASKLMSASKLDVTNLEFAIETILPDPAAQDTMRQRVVALREQNERDFRIQAYERGMERAVADALIDRSQNPSVFLDLDPSFTSTFGTLPGDVRQKFLEPGVDVVGLSQTVQLIQERGLSAYAAEILSRTSSLEGREEIGAFLDSLKSAVDHVFADWERFGETFHDKREMVGLLMGYKDPNTALAACKDVYGENYGKNFRDFYGLTTNNSQLSELNPGFVEGMVRFKMMIDEGVTTFGDHYTLSQTLRGRVNPAEYAGKLVKALREAPDLREPTQVMFALCSSENPEALGRAFVATNALIEGRDASIMRDLRSELSRQADPEAMATFMVTTEAELVKRGLNLEILGFTDFKRAVDQFKTLEDSSKSTEFFDRFCGDWRSTQEFQTLYQSFLSPAYETTNLSSLPREFRPKLDQMPALKQQFDELGISSELGQSLIDAWFTYDPVKQYVRSKDSKPSAVPDGKLDEIAKEQLKKFHSQRDALLNYARDYGKEELAEMMQIFGIRNLNRYKPQVLHDQYKAWIDGSSPVRNIAASAMTDWNGAFQNIGSSLIGTFGKDGLFFFEVNDEKELARVAVEVGKREREQGRKPQIENFAIDAHANSTGILLGVNGELLEVVDYTKEEQKQQKRNFRKNDYQRHLGENYRIILKACQTAQEVRYGKNIAKALSDGHEVRIEATQNYAGGEIVINPDGSVVFYTTATTDPEEKEAATPSITYKLEK